MAGARRTCSQPDPLGPPPWVGSARSSGRQDRAHAADFGSGPADVVGSEAATRVAHHMAVEAGLHHRARRIAPHPTPLLTLPSPNTVTADVTGCPHHDVGAPLCAQRAYRHGAAPLAPLSQAATRVH